MSVAAPLVLFTALAAAVSAVLGGGDAQLEFGQPVKNLLHFSDQIVDRQTRDTSSSHSLE